MTTQLIFILIVVGFSVVQAIYKHLAEQAEKRRKQQAVQREEMELLRTGRSGAPTEQSSPSDPEARRREELIELRRRAQARREPQPPTQHQAEQQRPAKSGQAAANPLEILLGLPPGSTSGGTVSPSPARTPRPQKDRGDAQSKRRRQEQQRLRAEQAAAEAKRKQELAELQARTTQAASVVEQRLLRAAKPVGTSRSPQGSIGLVPKNGAEWRRAIAMNEILSKPISMR